MKEQLFKIKESFHCEPIMQKEIVLKQKIAEPDLYLEEVLLLSKSFFSPPWVISKTLVVARESELISKEKNVIPELIDRSNDSPVCDDEDEGFEILCFFLHCIYALLVFFVFWTSNLEHFLGVVLHSVGIHHCTEHPFWYIIL